MAIPAADWDRLSAVEKLASLPQSERAAFLKGLKKREIEEFFASWAAWARPAQQEPERRWRVWLMLAGRGYGKTRAGAEWIHHLAEEEGLRIALVGPTDDEVRAVMVEGASGLLACARAGERPKWEPSRGVLRWPNGTMAFAYSGANPEGLRGPEHDFAWCDEAAKWARADAAWDNLMFGLRRGRDPRALVTTTPRPIPLMRRLIGRDEVAKTGGRTADNVLLGESFVTSVTGIYGGTRLGRQELDGELIEDVEGALWTRALIERSRQSGTLPREGLRRVVVGVDPPASAGGDACGIVACGLGADPSTGSGQAIGYVLGDHSARGLSPEGWARAVAAAAELWGADKVVVEANQGGEMVESVLRGADVALPVKAVHARYGKGRRAEPVATWFEKGKAKFAGAFPELEDELAGLTIGGGYEGPGRSPDRADAMVWAMTELLGRKERALPRVRGL